jgi:hypothetical protein
MAAGIATMFMSLSRGGLDWGELLCVLENRPWRQVDREVAINRVKALLETDSP